VNFQDPKIRDIAHEMMPHLVAHLSAQQAKYHFDEPVGNQLALMLYFLKSQFI
jgi:hypothetical protein